jgi:hypothetical protein
MLNEIHNGMHTDSPKMSILGTKVECSKVFRPGWYYQWECQLLLPWRVKLMDGTCREGEVVLSGHPHLLIMMN